jgi:hypothetical protein
MNRLAFAIHTTVEYLNVSMMGTNRTARPTTLTATSANVRPFASCSGSLALAMRLPLPYVLLGRRKGRRTRDGGGQWTKEGQKEEGKGKQ